MERDMQTKGIACEKEQRNTRVGEFEEHKLFSVTGTERVIQGAAGLETWRQCPAFE